MSTAATSKVAIPTVHLNGTSGSDLLKQYDAAFGAVLLAVEHVAAAAPHGRDYYVQNDPAAYDDAAKQHAARLKALATVRDELRDIVHGIRKQERQRATMRSIVAEMTEAQKKGAE